MKFSTKIEFMRKKRHISQELVAKKMGVSRQTIYKWEAGINTPEFSKIKKLAEILDISYDLLLDDNIDLEEYFNEKEETISEENNDTENPSLITPPSSNGNDKKRLILIIGIALLALIIAVTTAIVVIISNSSSDTDTNTDSDLITDTDNDIITDTNTDISTDTGTDTSTDTSTDASLDTTTDTSTDVSTDDTIESHNWSEWKQIDKGDCKTPQTLERFCLDCKATEKKEGEIVVEHSYSVWSVESPATCTKNEVMIRICFTCKEEFRQDGILALGHKFVGEVCERCSESMYTEGVKYTVSGTSASASFNANDIYKDEVINIRPYYTPEGSTEKYIVKTVSTIKSDYAREVIIPEGVEIIRGLWEAPNLNVIKIPSTIKDIYPSVFNGCSSINKVFIKDIRGWCGISRFDRNEPIFSRNYYMYLNDELLTDLHIPADINHINPYTFAFCTSIKRLTMDYNENRMIWNYAFAYSGLQYAQINGIEAYSNVFMSCYSLVSVDITGMYTYWKDTFSMCYRLVEVYTDNTSIKVGDTGEDYKLGAVAKYAKAVHYSRDEKSIITITDAGFVFATVDDESYLIQYIGSDPVARLPRSFGGKSYTIAERFYLGGSPNTRMNTIYVPKEITSIENNSLIASQYVKLCFEVESALDSWEQEFEASQYILFGQTLDY